MSSGTLIIACISRDKFERGIYACISQQEQMAKDAEAMAEFNLPTLRNAIVRMLKTADPTVLAIKGGWGEGKTHFWRTQILAALSHRRTVYVSLFSIENVQQLRERLLVELIPTSDRVGGSKAWNWGKSVLASIPGIAGKFGIPDHLVSGLIEASTLKPGLVVCLDDLERFALAKSENLGSLLGYINELRDRFRLKIVLIYNNDEIKGGLFRDFHEKVVDRDYAFAPTFDEVFEAAFPSSDETLLSAAQRDDLKQHCASLPLRNIRILTRLRSYLQELFTLAKSPSPFILRQLYISASLFVWAKYSKDAAIKEITLDFLKSFSGPLFDKENKDEKGQFLYSRNYGSTDDLDRIVLLLIQTDVLDEAALSAMMKKQNEIQREKEGLEALHQVWLRRFHGTLRDTSQEFCDELEGAVRPILRNIPAHSLDSSLHMLSALGRADAADRLFAEALAQGRQFTDDDFLMTRSRYEPLRARIEHQRQEEQVDRRGIGEVIQSAEASEFVQARDREALARFSIDDFVNYYSTAEFDRLTSSMRDLAKFARMQGISAAEQEIGNRVVAAARILAQRSAINRLRMQAMGLVPDEDGQGPN